MMENGLIGLVSSHFMDPEREAMSSHLAVDEEEEFYDFLPFQKEFLIPLRDRAFSWDVSFEDEIHGDNEAQAQAISIISEQSDSHRLVIKAKPSNAKRQAELKEIAVEAAEATTKKGKAAANNKKKEGSGITSPALQTSKGNLKAPTSSGSSGGANGRPQPKSTTAAAGAKNTNASSSSSTSSSSSSSATSNAKATAAARKIFNVASSPSTEFLDTQTLRNTLNNAKSSADKSEFGDIKAEFADLTSNGLNFGFGNEFETGKHSVAFDDALSIHFKEEDGTDFENLADETFADDFRPPRKLSWSIDFNAIEAAMDGGHMGPLDGGAYTGDSSMNFQSNYPYDGSGAAGTGAAGGMESSGVFPSLLRTSSDGPGGSVYSDASHLNSGSNMGHGILGQGQGQGQPKLANTNNSHGGASSSYAHTSGGADHSNGSSSALPQSMMMPSSLANNKANERDQLASLMSGALNNNNSHSHPHHHSNMSSGGMNMTNNAYANSLNAHSSGLGSSSGPLMNGESGLSSSGAPGGLTLGGLTVPNDGEFRVGAYTKLERHLKIEAFREKKRTRIWRKQIKYDCRKRLADTRPRVKGRFVSRKGDKGGDGGDDMDGPDGMDGLDVGGGPGSGSGPRSIPHSVLQGGVGGLSAVNMIHPNGGPHNGVGAATCQQPR